MKKQEWSITGETFDRLLTALDADREQAGARYEMLRRKLVYFFEWRGAAFPEEFADETLNIAARRIMGGEQIQNVSGYCTGIARMILLEKNRQREKERAALQDLRTSSPETSPVAEDARLDAFERCLRQLPAESRQLILQYYQPERHARIEARKALANRLGISLNVLRIRACRIRERLETSIREFMAESTDEMK